MLFMPTLTTHTKREKKALFIFLTVLFIFNFSEQQNLMDTAIQTETKRNVLRIL